MSDTVFSNSEFMKYALTMPFKVGKSYSVLFVVGLCLVLSYMLITYPYAALSNYFFSDTATSTNRIFMDLSFTIFDFLSTFYTFCWKGLIILLIYLVSIHHKTVLLKDVLDCIRGNLKAALFLILFFTLILQMISIPYTIFKHEWLFYVTRNIFIPILIMMFGFSLAFRLIMKAEIKQSIIFTLNYLNTGSWLSLIALFILSNFTWEVTGLVNRIILSEFYNNMIAGVDGIPSTSITLIWSIGNEIVLTVIEMFFLIIFSGGVFYCVKNSKAA